MVEVEVLRGEVDSDLLIKSEGFDLKCNYEIEKFAKKCLQYQKVQDLLKVPSKKLKSH